MIRPGGLGRIKVYARAALRNQLIRDCVVQGVSDGGFSAEAAPDRFASDLRHTRSDMRPRVRYCRPHPLIRLLWIFGHLLRPCRWSPQGVREMGSGRESTLQGATQRTEDESSERLHSPHEGGLDVDELGVSLRAASRTRIIDL